MIGPNEMQSIFLFKVVLSKKTDESNSCFKSNWGIIILKQKFIHHSSSAVNEKSGFGSCNIVAVPPSMHM